jgi:hypothetical protein
MSTRRQHRRRVRHQRPRNLLDQALGLALALASLLAYIREQTT